MSDSSIVEQQVPRVPIPRGERARERVLRAALEVLAEQGLPGFSMEAVAARAGASKATLYRHWPTRGALLVAAMDRSFQPAPMPATGALRSDLIELMSRAQATVSDSPFPRLMAAFIDAAERDPTLAGLHVELTERRREPIRRVLSLARERGDIPREADLELAVDLLGGPIFYRRFVAHRAFPRGYAATLVDHVLTAMLGMRKPA
ncbi:MAG: TetR/AcrR family transcriptional regulator [Candidatus Dormibacteraeota bacterium]|nr:TetR/AcrR family transcriptional regulator [Candidatus Dormibacteraeota bacterium]